MNQQFIVVDSAGRRRALLYHSDWRRVDFDSPRANPQAILDQLAANDAEMLRREA